ncbi:lipid II flippase MurJ [Flavobacterium sp. Arc3]
MIAASFGTGHEMDTYLLLTSFPFLISGVISSAFSFSLIPHFVTKSFNYFLQFIKICIVITLVLFVFFILVYHFFVIDYFNLRSFPNIEILNVIVWLVFLFTIPFSIISCYFTSKARFIIPVVLNFFPFIFSILCILIFDEIGVNAIIFGLLLGYLFSIFFSIYMLKNEKRDLTNVSTASEVFDFLKSMKYSVFSMLTFSVFQVVDAYWGSKLGESSISYLGYSQRIIIALGALVIAGPSSVLIPRLTESYKSGDLKAYYYDTSMIIKLVFALTSYAVLICSFFSRDIVIIMFQRGNFNEASTQNVAELLPLMLIGMVFMLSVVISFRSIFIQPINYKTGIVGILTFLIYFILSGIFSTYFNVKGIAVAYILTWIFIFCITIKMLYKTEVKAFFVDFVRFLSKQISVLVLIFGLVFVLELLFNGADLGLLGKLLKLSAFGLISLLIYLFISIRILKMKELIFLMSKIPYINRWI